jgi:hypothetical protein
MLDRARRAQVFPLDLESAGGIVFQVRMIAAKAVIAQLIGAEEEMGNENARVIAVAPAADNFAPVRESTRRSPARNAISGSIQRDSKASWSTGVRSEPTRLEQHARNHPMAGPEPLFRFQFAAGGDVYCR